MYFYFKPSQMFSIIPPYLLLLSSHPVISCPPDSKIYPKMCLFSPKGSLVINYELHANIYYCPRRYSPRTWPLSLLAGIFECQILVSRSQRSMQRNQVFGSGTTGNQWIIEGEKWSITFHPSGDEPIIPKLFV